MVLQVASSMASSIDSSWGTFSWEFEVCPGSSLLEVLVLGPGSASNMAFTMLGTSWSIKGRPELVEVNWWLVDEPEGLFHCFFLGGSIESRYLAGKRFFDGGYFAVRYAKLWEHWKHCE